MGLLSRFFGSDEPPHEYAADPDWRKQSTEPVWAIDEFHGSSMDIALYEGDVYRHVDSGETAMWISEDTRATSATFFADEFESTLIFDRKINTTDFYDGPYEHSAGAYARPASEKQYEAAMEFVEEVTDDE